jgi:FixJ family two-component response regulator
MEVGRAFAYVAARIFMKEIPVISIVDDDESLREALKSLVRSIGYHAAAYGSAEEFLDSGCVHDTSCLITDVNMEGLSGFDLQDRLTREGHAMPIIFVTALPEEQVRSRACEGGAFGFFQKPFHEEKLVACLAQAVRLPAPR